MEKELKFSLFFHSSLHPEPLGGVKGGIIDILLSFPVQMVVVVVFCLVRHCDGGVVGVIFFYALMITLVIFP